MSALLTYRSRDSFEARFGRNTPDPTRRQNINGAPQAPSNEHWAIHNDGHRNAGSPRPSRTNSTAASGHTSPAPTSENSTAPSSLPSANTVNRTDPEFHHTTEPFSPAAAAAATSQSSRNPRKKTPTYFSAQSYLRYQGQKFIGRFDANCYIAITRKLDTHDLSRYRVPDSMELTTSEALSLALKQIEQPTLVLGIESDGLFTFDEQKVLAANIPNARLETIDSPEGHDAFLLEFEQVNRYVLGFLGESVPHIMERSPIALEALQTDDGELGVTKSSTFGEAEAEVDDITAW
jgi:homoserine O-acetyltransferase/O-succinyltransferase